MKFWASSEIYKPADAGSETARKMIVPFLNAEFEKSPLATLDVEIRYIPIIMPGGMRECYPARSKLRTMQRLYDCAPQLNYEIFVEGTLKDQLHEYIRGISESAPHLARLGATPEQIEAFNKIMATAVERVLVE